MSMTTGRSQTKARTQVLARNAAQDGVFGAAAGLLIVSGLIAVNLQSMADTHAPLTSLATIVSVVVVQCAIAAGLCGLAVRKFAAQD